MKPLQLRTSLTLLYTTMLAVLVTVAAFAYHAILVRQLDADATTNLEEMARALHGYLQFPGGVPTLVYDRSDPDTAAFIDDASDYYQVYDARNGTLLVQSPGLESLGLHYTPNEVAEFRSNPSPRDVQTDRGRVRLISTLVTPAPDALYLVQVGELLGGVDRTLARFDELLAWRIVVGLALAAAAGWWLAGRALAPLTRLAAAARAIDITNLHDRIVVRGAGDELDEVSMALNEALARVERSVGEMRQFSAALAHELRTPLAILRGEAELALRATASNEDRCQALARQIDECDRLARLINQILTFARAEAGEITLERQSVDLGALGAAMVEQIEPVATAQGLHLTCAAERAVTVSGDPGWLERLLLILLDNAIKFTPDGGRIALTVHRADGCAQVAVRDSGIGIAADAQPHVFERFYQLDCARSRQTGAGLGLALAKWIAERHHGRIDVISRPGEGSTFTVSLPA